MIIEFDCFPIIVGSVVIVGDTMDGTSAPYYRKRALLDNNEGAFQTRGQRDLDHYPLELFY